MDARKHFLMLAYKQLNPDMTTLDGLEQALKNWYCFQYNVPPNDDKLMEMTLEELLILNQMHKLKENPNLAQELESGDYEEWLQKEMGADYVSEDDMIAQTEKVEAQEREEAEALPVGFHDDFSKVGE